MIPVADVFPGARWWKFDFHTHTPKSSDYGRSRPELTGLSAEDWVLACMRAKLDCVAVTDHNSGEWVDEIEQAINRLRAANHAEFRELKIFPGAELAVSGGTHVLLMLAPGRKTADVTALLGACGYAGKFGDRAGRGDKSLPDVLSAAKAHHALVIPAHVDEPNGLWNCGDMLTCTNALARPEIFAIERKSLAGAPPQAIATMKKRWAEVLGSDSHAPGEVGRAFTWVKMGQPSMEGLRLALLDGGISLIRSDQSVNDPNNARPTFLIESLEVSQAKFVGHVKPFRVVFNPWMNALIGGRGTGKSSLLEFARIVLRRENELGDYPDLEAEFKKKYAAIWAAVLRAA